MASRTALPSAVLVLRLITLVLLTASLAVIATDKINVASDPPQKFTFKDVYAYRYVLAIAVIGCAYTLLQIPFAAISIARRKRLIGGSEGAALFLICADVVFALLFASGAAAGFGFTYDVKCYANSVFDSSVQTPTLAKLHRDVDRFLKLAYVSAGLMLLAAACMALMIMMDNSTTVLKCIRLYDQFSKL